jgi:hypothetical protein
MGVYQIGDRIDLWASSFQVASVNTDPTTVAVKWGRSGTAFTPTTWVYGTDPQIAKVAVGVYSASVFVTAGMTGYFFYKFFGTTACHAAQTGFFEVANDWYS